MPRTGKYGMCVVPGCERAARTGRKDPATGVVSGLCEQHRLIAAQNGADLGTRGANSKLCVEPGCKTGPDGGPGPVVCRQVCSAHYHRNYRRTGPSRRETTAEMALRVPADQRQLPEGICAPPRRRVNSWREFLDRRVLIDPEDGELLRLVAPMEAALIESKGGKGGITAGEAAMVQNACLSRVAALMALKELGRGGAFITDQTGARVASAAMKELPKLLGAERGALQALGLGARLKKADSLDEWARRITAGSSEQEAGPIPSEATVVAEGPQQVADDAFLEPVPVESETPTHGLDNPFQPALPDGADHA